MLSADRKKLLELLGEYTPQDTQESKSKEGIISFVKREPDCFKRSLECGHITASAWLISRASSEALLMLHTKLGLWVQPGGHCDGNPDVLSVAIQEAKEESGIQAISAVNSKIFDVDVHLIPEAPGVKEHYHYDIRFLLQVTSDKMVIQNAESKALKWFGKNPLELPTDQPSVLRMHRKWVENKFTF